MLIRKLILFFTLLCFSVSVQAQQPTPQQQQETQKMMLEKMAKVVVSPLTQQDVDTFLKVVEASKRLKLEDEKAWDEINKLPPKEKEKKIKELSNLPDTEDYIVSIMRIQIATQVNNPTELAQIKQQYETVKQQVAAAKAQLASLPEEQRKTMEEQMNLSLQMMEMMVNYPKAGLDVYSANKTKIDEGIKFLEEE